MSLYRSVAELGRFLVPLGELDGVRLALSQISEPNPANEWDGSGRYMTLDKRVVREDRVDAALAEEETKVHDYIRQVFATARDTLHAAYSGEPAEAAALWIQMGEQAESRGAFDRALVFYSTAANLNAPLRDRGVQVLAIRRMARAYLGLGSFEESFWHYRRSAEIAADCRDLKAEVIAKTGAGNALVHQARYRQAEEIYTEALNRAGTHPEPAELQTERGQLLTNLSLTCIRQGRLDAAHRWMAEAAEVWRGVDSPVDRSLMEQVQSQLALEEGDLAGRRRHLEAALQLPVPPAMRAGISLDLAEAWLGEGNAMYALQWAREAEGLALQGGAVGLLARVYRGLGNVARDTGGDGVVFYEKALQLAQEKRLRHEEAETLLQYARQRARMGGIEEARDYVATATQILEELGLRPHERAAEILAELDAEAAAS
ncbi:MAG TPA: hypothetical protein VFE05_11975 [Longimicrobiaceae bacterium]|nr:hypothetical protein [Longimicrobiaceae bacterium]